MSDQATLRSRSVTMTFEGPSLFRNKFLAAQSISSEGTVIIKLPIGWRVLGYSLVVALIAAAIVLSTSTYRRVEAASGRINHEGGVAAISPSRAGTIESVDAVEGQLVMKGQVLATVRAGEPLLAGRTAPAVVRQALTGQSEYLERQHATTLMALRADLVRLRARASGAELELAGIDQQLAYQEQLIASATADYDNARTVAAKGFVSKRDVDSRKATVLARKQQLAQFHQLRAAKRTEIDETVISISRAEAEAEAQAITTRLAQLRLTQELAESEAASGYALVSPIDGHVTHMTAHIGLAVKPGEPIMMVLPSRSAMAVELNVPTASAGLLAVGQTVELAVDAFPYQRFGTLAGTITSIALAASQAPHEQRATYLVRVAVPRPYFIAAGRRLGLRAGMTVSAKIVVEERSLLQWLFEPLLPASKR